MAYMLYIFSLVTTIVNLHPAISLLTFSTSLTTWLTELTRLVTASQRNVLSNNSVLRWEFSEEDQGLFRNHLHKQFDFIFWINDSTDAATINRRQRSETVRTVITLSLGYLQQTTCIFSLSFLSKSWSLIHLWFNLVRMHFGLLWFSSVCNVWSSKFCNSGDTFIFRLKNCVSLLVGYTETWLNNCGCKRFRISFTYHTTQIIDG